MNKGFDQAAAFQKLWTGNVAERQHPGARRGLSRVCELPLPAKPADEKPDAFGPGHRRFAQDNLPAAEPDGPQGRLVPCSQTEPLNDLVSVLSPK
jgi:hypothetical protein